MIAQLLILDLNITVVLFSSSLNLTKTELYRT
jgi:hypothetical protein